VQATDLTAPARDLHWRDVINPRRELMIWCGTAMETCWSFGFFALALEASGHSNRGVSVFTYGTLVCIAIYSTRFLLNSDWTQNRKQVTSVVIAICTILLAIRGTLYSDFALFDISWLGQIPASIINFFIVFSPVSLLIGMGVYAWWRGVSLAQAAYDFESVGFRFRLGVLMLALLVLLNTWVGRLDFGGLLVAFFFFGLLAVALARQEDVGRAESSVSLPLRGPWLGILAGSVLLVLGLAAVLAALLTPKGIRAFFDLLRPIEPLVILVLYVILLIASVIVEFIFNLIVFVIQRLINPNLSAQPFQLPARPAFDVSQAPPDLSGLAAYWDPARGLCAIGLFAGVLLVLAFSLNQLQRRKRTDGNAERENVPVSLGPNPFKRLRDLFQRPNFGVEESDMATIRRIYANLTRLSAEHGFPRREAETPYEFMGELREALPASVPEERTITEAYVKVHYGEHSPSSAELAKVREAWKIVREKGKKGTT
jgi:hypothetical protein